MALGKVIVSVILVMVALFLYLIIFFNMMIEAADYTMSFLACEQETETDPQLNDALAQDLQRPKQRKRKY